MQVSGCGENTVGPAKKHATLAQKAWWASRPPDVTIDGDEFHTKDCSITRVSTTAESSHAQTLFTVPARLLTVCESTRSGEKPLRYDGKHLILSVCQTTFGAGGCAVEHYRSADYEHWEEYIGVTWINGEQYSAWRKLGSTSSKADSVEKVEN